MKNKNLHVVILAGGSGTRFWPLSRKDKPKQFLKIVGEKTLFQQTLERIRPLVSPQNIWIVTNQKFLSLIKSQLNQTPVPRTQLLLEPSGKNTAPAIAWASARIYRKNKNAVMVILPSDHLIKNPAAFLKHIREAETLARSNFLVTLGIVPTRPETGYGYLKVQKSPQPPFNKGGKGDFVFRVEKFTEKPSLDYAKKFLKTKKYFWNSGMFVWRVETILNEFQKHLPRIYTSLREAPSGATKQSRSFAKIWKNLPSVSIDYGILEKASRVAAIPAGDMGWSDLGSWEALHEASAKDQNGNVFQGNVISVDSKNTLIMAGKKQVAAVGLEDFVIIDTPDALLVCSKQHSQKIRGIAAMLKAKLL